MHAIISTHSSFEAADREDDAYYAALTPGERVAVLLDIVERYRRSLGEAAERLERVCRVADLEEG